MTPEIFLWMNAGRILISHPEGKQFCFPLITYPVDYEVNGY